MNVNNIRTGDSPKNANKYYQMRGRGGLPQRVTSDHVAVMRAEDAALSVAERLAAISGSRNCSSRFIDPAGIQVELKDIGNICGLSLGGKEYQVVLGVSARTFTPAILKAMGDFCFDYAVSQSGHLVHVGKSFARRALALINHNVDPTNRFDLVDLDMAISIADIWPIELTEADIHSFWINGPEKNSLMLFELNPPPYRDRFPLKVNKGTGLVIARQIIDNKGGN